MEYVLARVISNVKCEAVQGATSWIMYILYIKYCRQQNLRGLTNQHDHICTNMSRPRTLDFGTRHFGVLITRLFSGYNPTLGKIPCFCLVNPRVTRMIRLKVTEPPCLLIMFFRVWLLNHTGKIISCACKWDVLAGKIIIDQSLGTGSSGSSDVGKPRNFP